MMDAQWLAMHASYMEFNVLSLSLSFSKLKNLRVVSLLSYMNEVLWLFQEVLRATRTQLERELSLEDVHRIEDLPAYNLLYT